MTGAAIGLFFGTLFVWVPAVWLYFDADERGHSAYLWGGLALIPFWNIAVLVAYFVVRSRREGPEPFPYSRGRVYLNVALLTFWGLTAIAVAVVIFGLTDYVRTDSPVPRFETPRGELLRQRIAFSVALTLIAVPALAAHALLWRRARGRQAETAAGRAVWTSLASALVSVVIVLSGLIATLAAVGLVFEGVARLFDVGGDVDAEFSTFALSVLLPALGSIAIAYALWLDPALQRGREEVRLARADAAPAAEPPALEGASTPPPAPAQPPPSSEARFCAQCGAPLPAGARFCAACGTAVA
jgi:hypothetical protein